MHTGCFCTRMGQRTASLTACPFQSPANERPSRHRWATTAGSRPRRLYLAPPGGMRCLERPRSAKGSAAAVEASAAGLASWSSIFFTTLKGNKKLFSWEVQRGGQRPPAHQVWSGRLSVVSETTPALQAQAHRLGAETWERTGQTPEEATPVPICLLFCLRTSPWGWKAGLTEGHGLRTPLLSCHPSVRNGQSFPGAAARAREENASAGKCLPCLEIFTRGTVSGLLPAAC